MRNIGERNVAPVLLAKAGNDDVVARAGRLDLRIDLLAPGFDIDRFEDLRWLAERRLERPGIPCPRTLALLDEQRLWPPDDGPRSPLSPRA